MFDAFIATFETQFENEFFTGGLALAILGIVAALGRAALPAAKALVLRHFAVQITIDSRRPAYRQLIAWLHAHPYSRRCRRLMIDQEPRLSGSNGDLQILFTPAPGHHLLFHKGVPMWFKREATRGSDGEGAIGQNAPREQISITAITRDLGFVRNLISEAATFEHRQKDTLTVYGAGNFDEWDETARVAKRPIATIVVPGEIDRKLIEDVRHFLSSAQWYRARGVPWRRGYLLYGPPGTGKSSLIRAVAGELNLDLAVLHLASGGLGDTTLTTVMASAPPRSALVLEDIDAAFSAREKGEGGGRVTFSGLLNAIDGIAAQEGHPLFMTTNHPEQLDPALVRPGRVDLSLELELSGPQEAERLFLLFFPGEVALAKSFSANMDGQKKSPAEIQAHLLQFAHDPLSAVTNSMLSNGMVKKSNLLKNN